MDPNTREFLDEIDQPAVATPSALREDLAGGQQSAARCEEQMARLERMIEAAEVTESDPNVGGWLPMAHQKVGRVRDDLLEARRLMRRAGRTLGELEEVVERLREDT